MGATQPVAAVDQPVEQFAVPPKELIDYPGGDRRLRECFRFARLGLPAVFLELRGEGIARGRKFARAATGTARRYRQGPRFRSRVHRYRWVCRFCARDSRRAIARAVHSYSFGPYSETMSHVHVDLPRPHRLTVADYYRMADVGILAPDARVEGVVVDLQRLFG